MEFLGPDGLPGEASTAKYDVSAAQALAIFRRRKRDVLEAVTPANLFAEEHEN